jgi:hypothetical protein
MLLPDKDIGGGVVRRGFTRRGEYLKAGTKLTADEILAMPTANRKALIDAGYLATYPKAGVAVEKGKPFLVQVEKGKHNVIVGQQINDRPLSREEAERLIDEHD